MNARSDIEKPTANAGLVVGTGPAIEQIRGGTPDTGIVPGYLHTPTGYVPVDPADRDSDNEGLVSKG